MEALNYSTDETYEDDVEAEETDTSYESLCEICFERTMDANNSVLLKCGHRFHTACVISAYKQQIAQTGSTKTMQNSVKQCQYCRTSFQYLPYKGGTPILGLHDPEHVVAYQKHNMEIPDWPSLVSDRHCLYIIGGKYRYQQGMFRHTTRKMVSIRLTGGKEVRTNKTNVLLIKESCSPASTVHELDTAPAPVAPLSVVAD